MLGAEQSNESESDSGLSTDMIDEIIIGAVLISLVCITGLIFYKVIIPNL